MRRTVFIEGAIFFVTIAGLLVLFRSPTAHPAPATSTATLTAYKQPGVIPPPTKEAEKESAWPEQPTQPNQKSSVASATAIAIPTTAGRAVAASPSNISIKTVSVPIASSIATDDPYHDSMTPGGSKWATPLSTDVTAPKANANANTSSSIRAISARSAIAASTTTTLDRCATIAADFQQDCATANRWLDDIGTKYGALMQQHSRWLTAATVGDWRVNGCDPSPCDANGTGRVQPPDYFGAQGYDSPLGTCHSATPFRRAGAGRCSRKDESLGCSAPGAMSTLGVLGGTLGDDGRVRGWVRWHSGWYVGTVEDVACVDACSVGFDHPCDLSVETEEPAQRFDAAGKRFWSWWWGGDVNGEPPW